MLGDSSTISTFKGMSSERLMRRGTKKTTSRNTGEGKVKYWNGATGDSSKMVSSDQSPRALNETEVASSPTPKQTKNCSTTVAAADAILNTSSYRQDKNTVVYHVKKITTCDNNPESILIEVEKKVLFATKVPVSGDLSTAQDGDEDFIVDDDLPLADYSKDPTYVPENLSTSETETESKPSYAKEEDDGNELDILLEVMELEQPLDSPTKFKLKADLNIFPFEERLNKSHVHAEERKNPSGPKTVATETSLSGTPSRISDEVSPKVGEGAPSGTVSNETKSRGVSTPPAPRVSRFSGEIYSIIPSKFVLPQKVSSPVVVRNSLPSSATCSIPSRKRSNHTVIPSVAPLHIADPEMELAEN